MQLEGVINGGRQVFAGAEEVADTVAIDGTPPQPVGRRVRLYHQRSGLLVAQTWSGADGSYRIANIRAGLEFFAIADDHTRIYHPAALGFVTAAPGA